MFCPKSFLIEPNFQCDRILYYENDYITQLEYVINNIDNSHNAINNGMKISLTLSPSGDNPNYSHYLLGYTAPSDILPTIIHSGKIFTKSIDIKIFVKTSLSTYFLNTYLRKENLQ